VGLFCRGQRAAQLAIGHAMRMAERTRDDLGGFVLQGADGTASQLAGDGDSGRPRDGIGRTNPRRVSVGLFCRARIAPQNCGRPAMATPWPCTRRDWPNEPEIIRQPLTAVSSVGSTDATSSTASPRSRKPPAPRRCWTIYVSKKLASCQGNSSAVLAPPGPVEGGLSNRSVRLRGMGMYSCPCVSRGRAGTGKGTCPCHDEPRLVGHPMESVTPATKRSLAPSPGVQEGARTIVCASSSRSAVSRPARSTGPLVPMIAPVRLVSVVLRTRIQPYVQPRHAHAGRAEPDGAIGDAGGQGGADALPELVLL